MNDYFMQRQDTQPDPSLFEMRCRAERAERRVNELAAHVQALGSHLRMCRHYACYGIGESDALALQMEAIRNVVNQAVRDEPAVSLALREEDVIQRFLVEFNTHPRKEEFALAGVNGFFGWWKAKRRHERSQAEEKLKGT